MNEAKDKPPAFFIYSEIISHRQAGGFSINDVSRKIAYDVISEWH